MKLHCNNCGIHFLDDFEKTFQPPCNLWGEIGLSTLPVTLKKEMWDWAFSLPSDKIWLETGFGIAFDFKGIPVSDESAFVKIIPGYAEWHDAERQEFQRRWFAAKSKGQQPSMKRPELEISKEEVKSN